MRRATSSSKEIDPLRGFAAQAAIQRLLPRAGPCHAEAPEGRRSGLRGMAERAEHLGGRLEPAEPADGGTSLVWRVPVKKGPPPKKFGR